jgi:hypothetical protein
VPALGESVVVLEDTFNSLVVEALRPMRADDSSVASIRALTDVEIWRALREQGATHAAAVDQARSTVERWLAVNSSR